MLLLLRCLWLAVCWEAVVATAAGRQVGGFRSLVRKQGSTSGSLGLPSLDGEAQEVPEAADTTQSAPVASPNVTVLAEPNVTGTDKDSHCASFPGKRVIMTTVNWEYLDFFENWLLSAERHINKATDQIVVIPEQQNVTARLYQLRQPGGGFSPARFEVLEDGYSQSMRHARSDAATKHPYKSAGFNKLVNRRAEHVAKLVEDGCEVLYVDIDTVWLKNPLKDVEAVGEADLYLVDDAGLPRLVREHSCGLDDPAQFCSCFIYVRPTNAGKQFMRSWVASTEAKQIDKTPNQGIFNQVFCDNHGQFSYKVLPWEKYPSGSVLDHMRLTADKLSGDAGPTVLHANYRTGHRDKLEFMKKWNVWHVSQ
eukprot:TRINITY_DN82587_c0_g1_i1.p1 TRINITY_DN82587_c0_g1~~TRINITY_DN82587_c0_g1_i1.p1  ORF type:complete len:366 (+),score=55.97 TRINITY_DN82587_c0_g1_i1:147-1244(+)